MDLKTMRMTAVKRSTPPEKLAELFELNRKTHKAYGVTSALAHNPSTPDYILFQIIPELFWRDLMKLVASPFTPKDVSSKAGFLLNNKIKKMAMSEKSSFAILCPQSFFSQVVKNATPEIFKSFLRNNRLTEDKLVKIIHSPFIRKDFMRFILEHKKWGFRKLILKSLVYTKNFDLTTSLLAMKKLTASELEEISKNHSLHPLISKTAQRLLDKDSHPKESS